MIIFKSSNEHKRNEFKRLLNIHVEEGEDLREVQGTIDEVAIYKAIEAGPNILVEDSTMRINGREEVEIKWKWNMLKTGDKVEWIISLSVLVDDTVKVYRGSLDCIVERNTEDTGYVFEPYLIPLRDNPKNLSFASLIKEIEKDIVDPRYLAAQNYLNGDFIIEKKLKDIPKWRDYYQ